jgi:hypothetical protein
MPAQVGSITRVSPQPITEDTTHLENFLRPSSLQRYAARMTSISKSLLIALAMSAVVSAQSTPKKSQAKPQTAAATPSASENGKNQKDAAAKSSGHQSSMSGNHKDVMTAAPAPNQNSGHTNNMIGNHKDVMSAAAPAPSGGNNTQQSGTNPTAAPAAQPATPNKSTPDPNSPH